METVSKYFFEAALARSDIHNHRLYIIIILLVVSLVGTNAFWIAREMMYKDLVVTESTQDGEGVNIIGVGDVNYGTEGNDN